MKKPLPFSPEGAGLAGVRCYTDALGTSSLEQFPGDSYSNIRKLSEGPRRLRRGWERYRRGENLKLCAQERSPFHPHAEAAVFICSSRGPGVEF